MSLEFDKKTSTNQSSKKIMALGPFKILDYDIYKGKVVAQYNTPLGFTISQKTVYFNPKQILKIFKGSKGYYVIYETEHPSYFSKYLTPEIEGEELNEFVFRHYECNGRVVNDPNLDEYLLHEGCYPCGSRCAKEVVDYEFRPKAVNMNEVIFGEPELTIENGSAFNKFGALSGENTKIKFLEKPEISTIQIYKNPVTIEKGIALTVTYHYDEEQEAHLGIVEKYTADNNKNITGYKILRELTREEIEKLLPVLQKLPQDERNYIVRYLLSKGYDNLAEKVAGDDVFMLYFANSGKYANKYAEHLTQHPEKITGYDLNELYDKMKDGLVTKETYDKMLKSLAEYLINNIDKKGESYRFVLDVAKWVNEELNDKTLEKRLIDAVVGYLIKHPNVIEKPPTEFKMYVENGLITEQQFKDLINAYVNYLLNNPNKINYMDIYYLDNYANYVDPKTLEKLVTEYLNNLEKDRKELKYLRSHNTNMIIMDLEELAKKGLLPQQLVNKLRDLIEGKNELEPLLKEFEKEGIKVKIIREENTVYVVPEKYLDKAKFSKYVEILKKNGFKFDPLRKVWYKEL